MPLKFNPLVPPLDFYKAPAASTVTKAKAPLKITGEEVELEPEGITSSLLGFFNAGVPFEIPAGKTFEVPANIQGLWKESVNVQGTLNVQGHFDETFVVEPESLETGSLKNNAVTEAKTELPEMVKLTGFQTITGEKEFRNAKTEKLTFYGLKELNGLANLTLGGGTFALSPTGSEPEQLRLGPPGQALKQVKISGKVENGTQFETEPDCVYQLVPEGGAAELASIKGAGASTRHRVLLFINVSATETLTILHEGAGTAENRFSFVSGKNVKLEPKQTILLWYAEGTETAQLRWRDVGGCSLNLTGDGWAPVGVPTEVPSGKTYEVPSLISSLWRDNISVQGTMNVQGRLTEI